jgi:gas vesicle protein
MKDIFYFLLGALFGAGFALLFAPQSGAELRANIQATAEKDWQLAQEQLKTEQEKLHARLDQMQAELIQVIQPKEEAESSEAEEPAE